jgi:hypothetical protein
MQGEFQDGNPMQKTGALCQVYHSHNLSIKGTASWDFKFRPKFNQFASGVGACPAKDLQL